MTMGKSIRSNAAKHMRARRRERVQDVVDKQAEERAALARKYLAQAEPVRDPPRVGQETSAPDDVRSSRSRTRAATRRNESKMQWEPMMPVVSPSSAAEGPAEAMDVEAVTAARGRTKGGTANGSYSRRSKQGGKLHGVFGKASSYMGKGGVAKTTKVQRKKLKKREKRKQKGG